jgi:hypothetical protein
MIFTLSAERTSSVTRSLPGDPSPIANGASGRPIAMRAAGGVLVGAGLAAVITGAVLLALDGQPSCTLTPPQLQCPAFRSTAPEGGAVLGIGVAAAVTGAVLLIVDHVRHQHSNSNLRPGVAVHPGGVAFTFGGSFQ